MEISQKNFGMHYFSYLIETWEALMQIVESNDSDFYNSPSQIFIPICAYSDSASTVIGSRNRSYLVLSIGS